MIRIHKDYIAMRANIVLHFLPIVWLVVICILHSNISHKLFVNTTHTVHSDLRQKQEISFDKHTTTDNNKNQNKVEHSKEKFPRG